jgi:glycosyltransferase involved in cell wall biosynthesis
LEEAAVNVSVVIATKNSGDFLRECLESIDSQSLVPSEVFVIDAGSTDATRQIASDFTWAQVQQQVGKGLPNAWNQGLKIVAGEFIAMIDSDDYWVPEFLDRCVGSLTEQPAASLALAKVKFFTPQGSSTENLRPELNGLETIGNMPGATVFRRSLLDQIGFFPEEFIIASDIEWFARIRESNIVSVELPFLGLHKRMHDKNFSLDPTFKDIYQKEILQIARRRIIVAGKAKSELSQPDALH